MVIGDDPTIWFDSPFLRLVPLSTRSFIVPNNELEVYQVHPVWSSEVIRGFWVYRFRWSHSLALSKDVVITLAQPRDGASECLQSDASRRTVDLLFGRVDLDGNKWRSKKFRTRISSNGIFCKGSHTATTWAQIFQVGMSASEV